MSGIYVRFEDVRRPASNAKLWRFMDVTKFVDLLSTKRLFFARIDRLGDPWEGATSESTRVKREKDIGASLERVRKAFLETYYVSCWHRNQHESDAMWKLHVGNGRGIAITSTPRRIQRSPTVTLTPEMFIGNVRYEDYSEIDFHDNDLRANLFCKRASFVHEQEVRILIRPQANRPDLPSMFSQNSGIPIDVNLDALVDQVYVSPFAEQWEHRAVQALLDRFDLKRTVCQSQLEMVPRF